MNNEYSNENNNGFDNSSLNIFNGGSVDSNNFYTPEPVPMDTFDGAINNNSPELNIFGGMQNSTPVNNDYASIPVEPVNDNNNFNNELVQNTFENNYTQESDMTNAFDNSYTQESDMTNAFDNSYTQESDMSNAFDNSYAQESDMTNTFDNSYAQESDMTNAFDNSYAQESDMSNAFDNGYNPQADMLNSLDNGYNPQADMLNTLDNGYNQQDNMMNTFDNGYNQQNGMMNTFDNGYNQQYNSITSSLAGYTNDNEEPEPDYGPKIVKPELHAINDKPEEEMDPNQLTGAKAAKGYIIIVIIIGILLFLYFTQDGPKKDGPDTKHKVVLNVYSSGTSTTYGDYKVTVIGMSDESCLKWKNCNSKLKLEIEMGKEGSTKTYTVYADNTPKKLDDGKYVSAKPDGDKVEVTIYGVKSN